MKRLHTWAGKAETPIGDILVRGITKYLLPLLYFASFYFCTRILSLNTTLARITEQYMSSTSIIFGCMLGIYVATALSRYCNLIVGIIVGNFTMKMLASGLLATYTWIFNKK